MSEIRTDEAGADDWRSTALMMALAVALVSCLGLASIHGPRLASIFLDPISTKDLQLSLDQERHALMLTGTITNTGSYPIASTTLVIDIKSASRIVPQGQIPVVVGPLGPGETRTLSESVYALPMEAQIMLRLPSWADSPLLGMYSIDATEIHY